MTKNTFVYECCYIAEGKNILIVASLWDSPILDRKFVQENKRHENVYNDTPNSLSRKISQRMKCTKMISVDISIAFFLIVKKNLDFKCLILRD